MIRVECVRGLWDRKLHHMPQEFPSEYYVIHSTFEELAQVICLLVCTHE